MTYRVKVTCQGQLMTDETFNSLPKALWLYSMKVMKYGKYGTMRFDVEAY